MPDPLWVWVRRFTGLYSLAEVQPWVCPDSKVQRPQPPQDKTVPPHTQFPPEQCLSGAQVTQLLPLPQELSVLAQTHEPLEQCFPVPQL